MFEYSEKLRYWRNVLKLDWGIVSGLNERSEQLIVVIFSIEIINSSYCMDFLPKSDPRYRLALTVLPCWWRTLQTGRDGLASSPWLWRCSLSSEIQIGVQFFFFFYILKWQGSVHFDSIQKGQAAKERHENKAKRLNMSFNSSLQRNQYLVHFCSSQKQSEKKSGSAFYWKVVGVLISISYTRMHVVSKLILDLS